MTFRKDSLLLYQTEVFHIVMALACFALVPALGLGMALLYASPFLALMLVNPRLHNERITLDDTGISCTKSGAVLWAYSWESIAQFKRSTRFLMPSIEVITYDQYGAPESCARFDHYFQLGRTAKKAIAQYANRVKP